MSRQYQDYIDQLTSQTQHLQAQLNTMIAEREQQVATQQQLEGVIEDMKSQAQQQGTSFLQRQ